MAFDLAPFAERRRRFAEAIGDALAVIPALVFSLLQQLEALGLSVPGVLQQLGVATTTPPPPASVPVVEAPERPSRKVAP